jgi:alkanesulfonate monooxygenase SsuD/methylene tetrahydromethanopterin reductase-like flavin-dependent oxidoreductase (luciferase family)
MAGVNVICADTDEEARRLFTSLQKVVIGLVTGSPGRLAPPVDHIEPLPTHVQQSVHGFLACSFVGSPDTVRMQLADFVNTTGIDEVIVASAIYDQAARLHSCELLARACLSL